MPCAICRQRVRITSSELGARAARAVAEHAVVPWGIISDPGVGFAKTHDQNALMLGRLADIRSAFPGGFLRKAPMVVGPSRKGFLGAIVGKHKPAERDAATAAAIAIAAAAGGPMAGGIFRVHNVGMAADALKVADALAPLTGDGSVRRGL